MSEFWSDTRVCDALEVMGTPPGKGVHYTGVMTDTRSLRPGSLFVALRGERFDAHDFLGEAAEGGARGAVVEAIPEGAPADLVYYLVPDTLRALGALGRYYRRHLSARLVAIVGSNGKTSTKELARAALGVHYRVHATEGNLNNLIGVPLTLLASPQDAEILVVEVGTNSPGEVARLGAIVEPDVVIITSIAEEHLEGLGDLEGVLEEETSILRALPEDGLALIVEEPVELIERARELAPRVRVAGWGGGADDDLRARAIELDDEGRVSFSWRGEVVRVPLRGRVNARNTLLALGLAEEWGVPVEDAIEGLANAETPALRAEFVRYGELQVLADCYNSNPASLEAAVELLTALPRGDGRIVVVGSMRELGEASGELHRRSAAELAAEVDRGEVDLIVATGDFVEAFADLGPGLGDKLITGEEPGEAYQELSGRMKGGEVVLLKGSRGVALEELLPLLERDFGDRIPAVTEMSMVGRVADLDTGE